MPFFDSKKSKIKMVVLTKHSIPNQVYWSPLNQNGWKNDRIITGMLRRFKTNPLYALTNMVQFYENNVLIHKVRL